MFVDIISNNELFIVYSSYAHNYMHAHLLFILHLIGSLSDDPRFAHSDIGCFKLMIRCSMRPDMFRGARVFLYPF